MVNEGLVTAERDTNLLWEEGTKGVIHRWGKSHIDGHVPDGQDDISTAQEGGGCVADGVAKDRAKARL